MTDIYTTVLTKGDEHYIFLYVDSTAIPAIRTAAQWAGDTRLSMSWYDAARLSKEIRDRHCQGRLE